MKHIGQPATVILFLLIVTLSKAAAQLPPETTVNIQPSSISIAKNFAYNPGFFPPKDLFYIGQNFPSPAPNSSAPYDWYYGGDLSGYTGYAPPSSSLPTSQVTILDSESGVTSVQAHGDTGGIIINAVSGLSTTNTTQSQNGPLIFPVVPGEGFSDDPSNSKTFIAPWASGDPNAAAIFSIEAQIPYETSTNGQPIDCNGTVCNSTVAYATGAFSVRDESCTPTSTTFCQFWYGAGFFDPRGLSGLTSEYIHYDIGYNNGQTTGLAIVGTVALVPGQISQQGNVWGTAVWGAAGPQVATWSGYQKLRVCPGTLSWIA
jgi:hypothetical protein